MPVIVSLTSLSFSFCDLKGINVDDSQLHVPTVGKGPGKRFEERPRQENVEPFAFHFVFRNKQLVFIQNKYSYLGMKFYIYIIHMYYPFHVCVFFERAWNLVE